MSALLVAAQLGDTLTRFALPPGAELNPLAATWPVEAAAIKTLLIVVLLAIASGLSRADRSRVWMRRCVLGVGTAAGVVGLASNAWAILG